MKSLVKRLGHTLERVESFFAELGRFGYGDMSFLHIDEGRWYVLWIREGDIRTDEAAE